MASISSHATEARISVVGFLLAKGDYAGATNELDTIEKDLPDNPSVLYYRARIAHDQGRIEEAIHDYERVYVVTSTPESIGPLLAECYFLAGDHARAYRVFSDTLSPYTAASHNLRHYYYYAFSAYVMGETSEAEAAIAVIETLSSGTRDELAHQVSELKQVISETQ